MNEEEIRDEARKAANRSQFKSNHIYDHKSYEDGFYEGMMQALRIHDVSGQLPNNLILYRQAKKLDYAGFCKWINAKLGNLR
jgi:predicted Zn-dependent protease with MMP-like domain